jgi:penicillin G amidase
MISMGQSGNVFSPHYDDLLPLWAEAEYITVPTASDAVSTAAVHRLTLQPARSAIITTSR